MSEHMNIAVFASGSGSNFQAMVEHETIRPHIKLLVCDKPGAKVIDRAEQYGIPVVVRRQADFPGKESYEQDILKHLQEQTITWIFLAGYMRLIGPTLLHPFSGKIVNIHPSLLPDFPGLNAIQQALKAGVRETGVTIHFVDAGMDTGPVIAQQTVPVLPGDTENTLQTRVQGVEHTLYPETIVKLINK